MIFYDYVDFFLFLTQIYADLYDFFIISLIIICVIISNPRLSAFKNRLLRR
jgi:hypothetical protein